MPNSGAISNGGLKQYIHVFDGAFCPVLQSYKLVNCRVLVSYGVMFRVCFLCSVGCFSWAANIHLLEEAWPGKMSSQQATGLDF